MNNSRAYDPETPVNLTSGTPPQSLIEESERYLQEADQALQNNYHGKVVHGEANSNYQYGSHQFGYRPLLEEIAQTYGLPSQYAPAHILVTNGIRDGVKLVLDYLKSQADNAELYLEGPHKEAVLVPQEYYFRHLLALHQKGLIPIPIPETEGQIDLQALQKLTNERVLAILLTVSHNNPTGSCIEDPYSIMAAADVPLIFDEAYDQLNYDGKERTIDVSREIRSQLFLVSGFAKIIRPGQGYVLANGEVNWNALVSFYLSQTAHGGDTMLQQKIWQLIDSGQMNRHLAEINRENGDRMRALLRGLSSAREEIGPQFSFNQNVVGGYFVGGEITTPPGEKELIRREITSRLAEKKITLAGPKGVYPQGAWEVHAAELKLPLKGYAKRLSKFLDEVGLSPEEKQKILDLSGEPDDKIFIRFGANDQSIPGIERGTEAFARITKEVVVGK